MKSMIVWVLILCGCYSYRNTTVREVRITTPTRVEVTDAGSEAIAPQVGPRGRLIEGVVTEKSDTSVTLGIRALTRTGGLDEIWQGERIGIPSSVIARIQTKEFSVLRTSLLVLGLVGTGLVIHGASDGNIFGPGGGRPPGGGQ